MATKKNTPAPAPAKGAAKSAPKQAVVSKSAAPVKTEMRNTAIPKPAAAAPAARKGGVTITHEMIAKRAYEISRSRNGGSEQDNWHAAERELRGAK